MVPVEAALRALAQQVGIPVASLAKLKDDTSLRAAVLEEMRVTAKQAGLTSLELIEKVVLVAEEWTPANVSFSGVLEVHNGRVGCKLSHVSLGPYDQYAED